MCLPPPPPLFCDVIDVPPQPFSPPGGSPGWQLLHRSVCRSGGEPCAHGPPADADAGQQLHWCVCVCVCQMSRAIRFCSFGVTFVIWRAHSQGTRDVVPSRIFSSTRAVVWPLWCWTTTRSLQRAPSFWVLLFPPPPAPLFFFFACCNTHGVEEQRGRWKRKGEEGSRKGSQGSRAEKER